MNPTVEDADNDWKLILDAQFSERFLKVETK